MDIDAREVKVLDHGYVRLVAHMGNDLSIVRNARVSYDAAWREGMDEGSDYRLLKYLIENHHTSPLESVEFQFEIFAPIFVMRQWMRHRTWSYNEVSARYKELPSVFYVPNALDIGAPDKKNKQSRSITPIPDAFEAAKLIRQQCEEAFRSYQQLLAMEVPRELARGVLPVNTYTHVFGKVDLKNLLHFLDLRLHEHSQMEIRVYAEAIKKIITPFVPQTIELWDKAKRKDMDIIQLMEERVRILEAELRDLRLLSGLNHVVTHHTD
jgi:thymidylate synthase (FAD)